MTNETRTPSPTADEVLAFLHGSGPLDGRWFGDGPPFGERGNFWWRKYLDVLARTPSPADGIVTIPITADNLPVGPRWEVDGSCWRAVKCNPETQGCEWRWQPENAKALAKEGPEGGMTDYLLPAPADGQRLWRDIKTAPDNELIFVWDYGTIRQSIRKDGAWISEWEGIPPPGFPTLWLPIFPYPDGADV